MGDLKKNNSGTEAMKLTRLPLTSDYVFKRIFAREENNSMLKDFLEAILNIHNLMLVVILLSFCLLF